MRLLAALLCCAVFLPGPAMAEGCPVPSRCEDRAPGCRAPRVPCAEPHRDAARRDQPPRPHRTVEVPPYRDGDVVVHEHHHYYHPSRVCGFSCWLRRVKRGYCGSGCGYYHERMRR